MRYASALPPTMARTGLESLRREIARPIHALGTPGRDPRLQKYVGSPVPVLGLKTAEMRWILDGFAKAHPDLDARTVHALAGSLWRGDVTEERWAGIGVLQRTRSKNFWRRRVATYALNRFVRAGELDKPLSLLKKLLYDPEFWVQRAVGTWLRECWKKDERRVRGFLVKLARGLAPA